MRALRTSWQLITVDFCLFATLLTSWGGGCSAGRSHGATRGHVWSYLCGGDEWKVQSRELSVTQRAWYGSGGGAHPSSSRLPCERWAGDQIDMGMSLSPYLITASVEWAKACYIELFYMLVERAVASDSRTMTVSSQFDPLFKYTAWLNPNVHPNLQTEHSWTFVVCTMSCSLSSHQVCEGAGPRGDKVRYGT